MFFCIPAFLSPTAPASLFIDFSSILFANILAHDSQLQPGSIVCTSTLYIKEAAKLSTILRSFMSSMAPLFESVQTKQLHFAETKAFMDIYRMGTGFTKDPWFYNMFRVQESSFGLVDVHQHRARRGLLSPSFHRRGIDQLQHVDRLISQLGSTPDVPINLQFAFRAVALEIITSYAFGKHIGCLDTPGFHHQLLIDIEGAILSAGTIKWFPIVSTVLSTLPEAITVALVPSMQSYFDVRNMLAAQIDEILADHSVLLDADHDVVYTHLLDPQNEKHTRPSRKSLLDEAQLLIQAGSDTVGNTVYTGLFYAMNDPNVYSALRSEIDIAWKDTSQPLPLQQLEELPYLTAFIKEALRVSHGVVSPLPRVVHQDTVIAGYPVPAGTVIASGITIVHYDPDIFESPKEFRPERWLSADGAHLENFLVPFGRGSRQCLGMNLAWAELYLIFGNILRKLDFEMHNTGAEDFARLKDYFVTGYAGRHFHAFVRPREPSVQTTNLYIPYQDLWCPSAPQPFHGFGEF
ncbi:cytochrome P450 [Cylindrobasidium torrendii FP15055 ss-10]|uniref:Cytochrome P450 n=1 Tax=Cylindrobasidium torrendii FP15055 ss-10 TaxID=1314674 RepID=A0A0D7BRF2_9AGAR|nr:cytochrome P450 [Cylindrobasidium torrendii FP15055 ss-10]